MKKLILLAPVILLASCRQNSSSVPELHDAIDSISFCIGLNLGDDIVLTNYKLDIGDELDYDLLVKGIKVALNGQETINSDVRFEILRRYFNETLPELNAGSSEDFIKRAQKAKPNAVTTSSGLVYEIVKQGNENRPDTTGIVYLKYEGRRMDGSLYETTYDIDDVEMKPMEVMIPGMREGLTHIGEGGIIKLWILPELAYGKKGNDYIGPNQALYYYIELVSLVQNDCSGDNTQNY